MRRGKGVPLKRPALGGDRERGDDSKQLKLAPTAGWALVRESGGSAAATCPGAA